MCQGKKTELAKMAVVQQKCCVFIDNSNLFIQGKKFFARHLRLSVLEDERFRIDMGRIVEALLQGCKLKYAKLYGYEPPANDSLWKMIRSRGIVVDAFQRNSKDAEKEVDTSLTADVTEMAGDLRDEEPTGSVTFIIIGGDRDYLPCSDRVLKRNWKLEIAAWDRCLAQKVRKFVQDNQRRDVSLIVLDSLATKNPGIYFLEDKWKEQERPPRDRTIVFELGEPVTDKGAKQLNSGVTDLVKFPCRYMHRPEKDPNIVMIIIIIEQKEGKYSTLCTKKSKRNSLTNLRRS